MSPVDAQIEDSLLILTASGDLTSDEIIATVRQHYTSGKVKDVIWDLTNASLQLISRSGFEAIAGVAKEAVDSGGRISGKTAYIGTSDVNFGLLRMYTAIAEITGVEVKYYVFKSHLEARKWIAEPC